MGFPGGSNGKESACNEGDSGLKSWDRKIPWRKTCKHNPVFLPEKFHGQRSLAGYKQWGHKEPDTTELLTCHLI